jgi:hypothetical protein
MNFHASADRRSRIAPVDHVIRLVNGFSVSTGAATNRFDHLGVRSGLAAAELVGCKTRLWKIDHFKDSVVMDSAVAKRLGGSG